MKQRVLLPPLKIHQYTPHDFLTKIPKLNKSVIFKPSNEKGLEYLFTMQRSMDENLLEHCSHHISLALTDASVKDICVV